MLIDYIYPPTCGFCGEKINKRYTCRKCLNIIEYYKEIIILNTNKEYYFDKLICALDYKGFMRLKMLQFKFNDYKYLSKSFADILARKIEKYKIEADYISFVPIHKKRYFERGYNQSEYIAKYVSKLTNIKLEKNILIKEIQNKTQSTLSHAERKQNVRGVYKAINKEKIFNNRIILIDDIYTTGATMNECAKELKLAGAKEVIAMTVLHS